MRALLIDTSYFIFHRYFATHRWYMLRNKDADAMNVLKDEHFVGAYYKHLDRDIDTLRKKYESDVWFVMDCPRCDIWRMEKYPQYKGTRKHADTFDGEVFPLTYKYLETIRDKYNLRFIKHPRMEADDLCFVCQEYFLSNGVYDHITILANDNDYLQMVSDKVEVFNKEGKAIKERGSGDPSVDMLKKVLTGDKSDNIPPICKGVGPKTADKIIAMSHDDRTNWIKQKGVAAWDQYMLNTELINLAHIPLHLVSEVVENLKTI